jgi:hypothetical protein
MDGMHGRGAMAKAVSRQPKDRVHAHVGYVVDRVALGQVALKVLLFFPCQCHFTGTPNSYIIWG